MFYNGNRVLYMSLHMHRYNYASFFPQSEDADYDMVGEGTGKGFKLKIPWNGRKMGDSECLLEFHMVVLPIAYEFHPHLILTSAGFDAAVWRPSCWVPRDTRHVRLHDPPAVGPGQWQGGGGTGG